MPVPSNLIVTDLTASPAEMQDVSAFEFANFPSEKAYFEVEVLAIGRMPEDKPDARRVFIKLPNDAEMFIWLHSWKDANGAVLPGLTDNQIGGRKAAWLTALQSCGWTEEQVHQNTWAINWLIMSTNGGKKARVAYWPPDPANNYKYADAEFVTKTIFDSAVSRSQVPGNVRPSDRGNKPQTDPAAAAAATGSALPGGGLPGAAAAANLPGAATAALPGGNNGVSQPGTTMPATALPTGLPAVNG